MPRSARTTASQSARRRRADAERSVAAILDAAVDALAENPEASMAQIARRAGVVRATIYVHFPTRETLIEAVTKRTIAQAVEVIAAADPDAGDPVEALRRVLIAAWRYLERYHALVEINRQLSPDALRRRHRPVLALLQPLIERGQQTGAFRSEQPAQWHLSMLLALIHAASGELRARNLPDTEIERALVQTGLGALGAVTETDDGGASPRTPRREPGGSPNREG